MAIPLAVYLVLVHLAALLGFITPPDGAAKGGLLYQSWFAWTAAAPFFSALAALVLVFLQSVAVNALADEFRLMSDRSWFPGFFYGVAASALPDFQFVSAPLVAATFVPFALWRIYNAYQKPQVTAAIFDSGLWIAVAALFYPPALLLLVAAFAGLEVVRVFRMYERVVFLIGAFVPLFLAWLWYFWANRGGEFRDLHWGGLFQLYRFDTVWDEKMMVNAGMIGLLAVVFVLGISSINSRKGIQSQKYVAVLYWFLGLGICTIFLQPAWSWAHFLLPAAAVGILLAFAFQSFRHRQWAEIWHLVLFLALFFVQFSDFFLQKTAALF